MKLTNEMLIRVAQVHQPVDVGGFITKKTISDANMPGLKMWLTPLGLIMIHRGVTAVIPHANLAIALFENVQFDIEKNDK